MTVAEAKQYLNKHCFFKLKTGKEVFGVIWEVYSGNETTYFFTSAHEHEKIKQTQLGSEALLKTALPIHLEDIVFAQRLVS